MDMDDTVQDNISEEAPTSSQNNDFRDYNTTQSFTVENRLVQTDPTYIANGDKVLALRRDAKSLPLIMAETDCLQHDNVLLTQSSKLKEDVYYMMKGFGENSNIPNNENAKQEQMLFDLKKSLYEAQNVIEDSSYQITCLKSEMTKLEKKNVEDSVVFKEIKDQMESQVLNLEEALKRKQQEIEVLEKSKMETTEDENTKKQSELHQNLQESMLLENGDELRKCFQKLQPQNLKLIELQDLARCESEGRLLTKHEETKRYKTEIQSLWKCIELKNEEIKEKEAEAIKTREENKFLKENLLKMETENLKTQETYKAEINSIKSEKDALNETVRQLNNQLTTLKQHLESEKNEEDVKTDFIYDFKLKYEKTISDCIDYVSDLDNFSSCRSEVGETKMETNPSDFEEEFTTFLLDNLIFLPEEIEGKNVFYLLLDKFIALLESYTELENSSIRFLPLSTLVNRDKYPIRFKNKLRDLEDMLAEKIRYIESLEARIAILEDLSVVYEEEKTRLQIAHELKERKLEEVLSSKTEELRENREKLMLLREQEVSLTEEIAYLKEKLSKSEEENEKSNSKLGNYEENLTQKENSILSHKAEIERLKSRLDSASQEEAIRNIKMAELVNQLDEVRTLNQQETQHKSEIEARLTETEKELENFQREAKRILAENKELKEKYEEAKNRIIEKEEMILQLHARIDALITDNDFLNSSFSIFQEKNKQVEDRITDLETNLNKVVESAKNDLFLVQESKNKRIEMLNGKVADLESNRKSEQEEHEKIVEYFKEMVTRSNSDLSSRDLRRTEMERETQQSKNPEALKEKLERMEEEMTSSMEKNKEMETTIATLKANWEKAEKQLKEKDETIRTLNESLLSIATVPQKRNSKSQTEVVERLNPESTESDSLLKARLEENVDVIDKLNSKVKKLMCTNSQLECSHKIKMGEIGILNEKLTRIEVELERQFEERQEKTKKLNERIVELLADQDQLKSLKSQLTVFLEGNAQLQLLITHLETEIKCNEVNKLELKVAEDRIKSLQNENIRLNGLVRELSRNHEEVEIANVALSYAQAKNKELEERIAKLEISEMVDEMSRSSESSEFKFRFAEEKESREKFRDRIEELEINCEQLESMTMALAEAETKNKFYEEKILILEDRLTSTEEMEHLKEAELEVLGEELIQAQESLRIVTIQNEEAVANLKTCIQKLTSDREKMEPLSKSLAESEMKRAKLEETVTTLREKLKIGEMEQECLNNILADTLSRIQTNKQAKENAIESLNLALSNAELHRKRLEEEIHMLQDKLIVHHQREELKNAEACVLNKRLLKTEEKILEKEMLVSSLNSKVVELEKEIQRVKEVEVKDLLVRIQMEEEKAGLEKEKVGVLRNNLKEAQRGKERVMEILLDVEKSFELPAGTVVCIMNETKSNNHIFADRINEFKKNTTEEVDKLKKEVQKLEITVREYEEKDEQASNNPMEQLKAVKSRRDRKSEFSRSFNSRRFDRIEELNKLLTETIYEIAKMAGVPNCDQLDLYSIRNYENCIKRVLEHISKNLQNAAFGDVKFPVENRSFRNETRHGLIEGEKILWWTQVSHAATVGYEESDPEGNRLIEKLPKDCQSLVDFVKKVAEATEMPNRDEKDLVSNLDGTKKRVLEHLRLQRMEMEELKALNVELDGECDSYAKVIKDVKKEAASAWKEKEDFQGRVSCLEKERERLRKWVDENKAPRNSIPGKETYQRCQCNKFLREMEDLKLQKTYELHNLTSQCLSYKSEIKYLENSVDHTQKKLYEEKTRTEKLEMELNKVAGSTDLRKPPEKIALFRKRSLFSQETCSESQDREKIKKLTKDNAILKELCRSRLTEIKKLEAEISGMKNNIKGR